MMTAIADACETINFGLQRVLNMEACLEYNLESSQLV